MRVLFTAMLWLLLAFLLPSCGLSKPCSGAPANQISVAVDENYLPPATEVATKHCSCELGATVTSITGDADSYNKSLVGGQVGFSYLLGQGPLGFKPGINVSMAGSKYQDTYVSGSVRLLYLNIPLLAQYSSPSGFFAEAGLQPGILLSAKDKYNGQSYDFKDYVRSFDLGLPLGIGYVCRSGLGAGVRVVPGIANLNKQSSDGTDHNFAILFRALFNF